MPFTLTQNPCRSCGKRHTLYCDESDAVSNIEYEYVCPETSETCVYFSGTEWSKVVRGAPAGSVSLKEARQR